MSPDATYVIIMAMIISSPLVALWSLAAIDKHYGTKLLSDD